MKHTKPLLLSVALGCSLAPLSQAQSATPLWVKFKENTLSNIELKKQESSHYQTQVKLPKGLYFFRVADSENNCGSSFAPAETQRIRFNKSNPVEPCIDDQFFKLKVIKEADYLISLDNTNQPAITVKRLKGKSVAVKRKPPAVECQSWDGKPVTVDVHSTFSEGETVRDFYSGQTTQVSNGQLTFMPAAESGGLLLLESVDQSSNQQQTDSFDWRNATVYFAMTDRFANGDTSNDNAYGRRKDNKQEIGTFHGGDLKGVTEKLDYLQDLGVTAIWLTPLAEQVHGFVGGGKDGSFPFYGYHGYWAKDFTKVDAAFGDEAAMTQLVDEAHKRGIRVVLDIVLNHPGYATAQDLAELTPELTQLSPEQARNWSPAAGENWHDINRNTDFNSRQWNLWWGKDWVRAGLPGYQQPGTTDETINLSGLPDFITESEAPVDLPVFLKRKKDTFAEQLNNATVTDYLIKWQTDWVRKYGIDGFRADTVKHIDPEIWQKLKLTANQALNDWRAANPEKTLDDQPFWMVGEYWGHGANRDYLYDNGFDSIINFDFQRYEALPGSQCLSQLDPLFRKSSKNMQESRDLNPMNYISSHDTKLFWNDFKDIALQKSAATALMMAPGAAQIYYGDETARDAGAHPVDDPAQGTRSDMNWSQIRGDRSELLKHWQVLSNFRKTHSSVGAGEHHKLSDAPYSFSRVSEDDRVMVVYPGKAS
ncbi:alpha-amylase [Endozoicomonas sp. OPT23]|uniref:alpha-amylase n=1 Tax=Endozoicomonas sp. OPT23 TaxID=2072845 RepID=UPI00129A9477|nr:alpha-amylase [Endozoicomonas sp. OPT23]MRI32342.1 alpha-amylase [Endozoicomonas sp. OPT23]